VGRGQIPMIKLQITDKFQFSNTKGKRYRIWDLEIGHCLELEVCDLEFVSVIVYPESKTS
jgi:hypothetical protein